RSTQRDTTSERNIPELSTLTGPCACVGRRRPRRLRRSARWSWARVPGRGDRGEMAAFLREAAIYSELWEVGVCTGLLEERRGGHRHRVFVKAPRAEPCRARAPCAWSTGDCFGCGKDAAIVPAWHAHDLRPPWRERGQIRGASPAVIFRAG